MKRPNLDHTLAVSAVINSGYSVVKASKQHGVPTSTLYALVAKARKSFQAPKHGRAAYVGGRFEGHRRKLRTLTVNTPGSPLRRNIVTTLLDAAEDAKRMDWRHAIAKAAIAVQLMSDEVESPEEMGRKLLSHIGAPVAG
jgi:transposase-like protein